MNDTLHFDGPAPRWFDALPIGNGRTGGMVHHDLDADRIQLSESTAWSGAPTTTDVNPGAAAHLAEVRAALFDGRADEAQRLADEHLLGRATQFGTNLPLPEVVVAYASGATSVRRSLDIADAIAAGERDGVRTETWASNPDALLVHRIVADAPLDLVVTIGEAVYPLTRAADGGDLTAVGRAVESLHSDGVSGVALAVRVRAIVDAGSVLAAGDRLEVTGATDVTLLIAVGTSWNGADEHADALGRVERAAAVDAGTLRERHVADHRSLFDRVTFDLGPSAADVRELATDRRRALFAAGGEDPELVALYFRFGRYLTIAGSRHDSPLPLALQGLWNDGNASSAPWTNDFHLDINTQQNYWAAEVTGLGETQEPLLRFVERLALSGRSTARDMYGASGWVAHTVTNAWGYSAPGWGAGWGMAVVGGAWIALQTWERYEFDRDEVYLRERAYPVLRGAADFWLDYLVEHPTEGFLVSGPSDSPENWYLTESGAHAGVSMGGYADRVFAEATLRNAADAARILGVDAAFAERADAARARLTPFRIGALGQVQEWFEDHGEAYPNHRHTSHLHALYPERQITVRRDPELAAAARVTIDRREAADGWEQTEWTEGNFIAFFARLLDGDRALRHVRNLIADASEANLMSYSRGGVAGAAQNIYSFDGNTAGTGAIAEMLVQSDGEEIELLPALPSAWRQGSVTGLRAKNGVRVDVRWADGAVAEATLVADRPVAQRLRIGDEVDEVTLTPGVPFVVSA